MEQSRRLILILMQMLKRKVGAGKGGKGTIAISCKCINGNRIEQLSQMVLHIHIYMSCWYMLSGLDGLRVG